MARDEGQGRGRFPSSVYDVGTEPDARFTLANERTFLAWVGFGLASISLGVGLESFALGLEPHLRMAASLLLIVLGAITPVQAWIGWQKVERAMRTGSPLPAMSRGIVLAACVVIAAVLVGLGVVLR